MIKQISLVLCLIVGLLLRGAISVTPDKVSLNNLDKYLKANVATEDPEANVGAIRRFNSEISSSGNEIPPVFEHFGQIFQGKEQICDNSYQVSLAFLDKLTGHKACKPMLIDASRVVKVVHQVCRLRAQLCPQVWAEEYSRMVPKNERYIRFIEGLRDFLRDVDSRKYSNQVAKCSLVEKNLKSPKAGRFLAMALHHQSPYTFRGLNIQAQDVNDILRKGYQTYLVEPCKEFFLNYDETYLLSSANLALKSMEPVEVPVGTEKLFDGVHYSKICRSVVDEASAWIEKIRKRL